MSLDVTNGHEKPKVTVTLVRWSSLHVQDNFRGIVGGPAIEKQLVLEADTVAQLRNMIDFAGIDGWRIPVTEPTKKRKKG